MNTKNYYRLIENKEEALDLAHELQEKLGELASLYEELEDYGYDDYKIKQEISGSYVGDTLSNLINDLEESIEQRVNELEEEKEAEEQEKKELEEKFEVVDLRDKK